ncbi:MAG: hypothetical protein GYA17_18415, partial [Chloroflexi bacterium]|nr:hypothetical protein [Chloroflexota bacterium]
LWITLLVLTFVFTQVGRGLGILDDYQNLPVTSMMAAGDIPPHFPLDPKIEFSYHYFSLLFASQLMRLAGLHAWNALDIARAFGFAVSILLWALFVQRVTRSRLAAFLAGMMNVFSGGTRWLLLLLPEPLLRAISPHIQLMGSGLQSGPDLITALTSPWAFEGAGPFPIPFAYLNGISAVGALTFQSGTGGIAGIMGGILILTHNRWRQGWGFALTTALLAAGALSSEVGFLTNAAGFALVGVVYVIQNRTLRLPRSLWQWLLAFIPAGLIAAFQGGVLTGVVHGLLAGAAPVAQEGGSYFTFGFSLFWPPAFLSSHLGFLSLFNPAQLLVALAEIGPIVLVLPLVLAWGIKAQRSGRWYEAAAILLPVFNLVTLVIQYTGNAGPTALTRVQGAIFSICAGWAVPVLWLWARHRSDQIKTWSAVLLFVTMFGGFVVLGTEMVSAPKPMYAPFIDTLDARMEARYWNKLEPDAMIFDPTPFRSPTIFARPTNSHITWYVEKPEWEKLHEAPTPGALRAAGFDYAYYDATFWEYLPKKYQRAMEDSCVVLVHQEEWNVMGYDFRRLVDLRGCPADPGS